MLKMFLPVASTIGKIYLFATYSVTPYVFVAIIATAYVHAQNYY